MPHPWGDFCWPHTLGQHRPNFVLGVQHKVLFHGNGVLWCCREGRSNVVSRFARQVTVCPPDETQLHTRKVVRSTERYVSRFSNCLHTHEHTDIHY